MTDDGKEPTPVAGLPRVFAGARRVLHNYSANRCTFMAAAVSFYAFFAVFPFTLLALIILSYVLDPLMVRDHISAVAEFFLLHSGNLVEENLERMMDTRRQVGLFSVLALYWASSGIFFALRTTLNRVWQVPPSPSYLRSKSLDLAITSFFLLLLALSAAGSTALRALVTVMSEEMPTWLRGGTGLLFSLSVSTILFALAYRIIPNAKPSTLAVLLGGAVGSIGFELVRSGFTWYLLTLSPYQLVYGSLGTVIAFLFWIYLSVAVFLFGATVGETVEYLYRSMRPHDRAREIGPSA